MYNVRVVIINSRNWYFKIKMGYFISPREKTWFQQFFKLTKYIEVHMINNLFDVDDDTINVQKFIFDEIRSRITM